MKTNIIYNDNHRIIFSETYQPGELTQFFSFLNWIIHHRSESTVKYLQLSNVIFIYTLD